MPAPEPSSTGLKRVFEAHPGRGGSELSIEDPAARSRLPWVRWWAACPYWRRLHLAAAALGLGLAAISCVLAGYHFYRGEAAAVERDARRQATAVATQLVELPLHALVSPADRQTRTFRQVQTLLGAQLRANPALIGARLMRPTGEAGVWVVIVDERSDGQPVVDVGQRLRVGLPGDVEPVSATVFRQSTADGLRYTAVAPVASAGAAPMAYVALLFDATELQAAGKRVAVTIGLGFAVFALAWLAATSWLGARMGHRVDRLRQAALDIRAGAGMVSPTQDFHDLRPAAALLNELAWAGRERDRLQAALSKYVSGPVARLAAQSDDFLRSRGKELPVTVMFADLYEFTELSQSMSAPQAVEILNRCFSAFAFSIQKYNGTVDKFIGDSVMALFGAPVTDNRQAEHAVMAAIEMRAAMTKLRRELKLPSLRIGVGINTGVATVGNVGSEDRFQYTAIGQAVNLAARIEAFTRSIGGGIVIGADTAAQLDDDFVLEEVSGVRLKGVRQLVNLYKVKAKIKR